jgi:CDP-glycerol glycerophosphotransferase (TagB/SpsB family)
MDFYEILNAIDVLITDYSSLYFDYLLLNRPIIFTPVDLDDYRLNKGFMLEPYDEWTPGDKVFDFHSLMQAMTSAIRQPALYEVERKRLSRIIHAYEDGNSTQRVVKLIKDVINEN